MAGTLLKAAAISKESAMEMIELTKRQLKVTMFAVGAGGLEALKSQKLVLA
jgi:isopentenyl diphosphate isomerase/L-lactate dehydrogenase-like FMN-dependent dehydrogenase